MREERDGERDGRAERDPGPGRPAFLPPVDQRQHHRHQARGDQGDPGQVEPGAPVGPRLRYQARAGLTPAGPGGALFPAGFFELHQAELTAFVPVDGSVAGAVAEGGRAELVTIPGVEAAVMLHPGSPADSDQTYGALGTVVAERAIGVEGPIREYYLVPFTEPDLSRHRTEICWPVFQTA